MKEQREKTLAARCTRRDLLWRAANGIGGLALYDLLSSTSSKAQSPSLPRRAKSVIFLYMDGGPSQVDTFDYKPRLQKDHGKRISSDYMNRYSTNICHASPFRFERHGQCGAYVSEVFPHIAGCVDDITFIHSMVAEHVEHPTANMFMLTGASSRGKPSMGSWISYGLGSECKDLPAYVVVRHAGYPQGGVELLGSGFLPASHAPSIWDLSAPQPVRFGVPIEPPAKQRSKLQLAQTLGGLATTALGTPETPIESMVANYELAFQMQSSVPELMQMQNESKATLDLYGITNPLTETFGRQCLIARRLIQKGVRFVTLFPPTTPGANRWDQHDTLERYTRENALLVDQPMAGLLKDLKSQGMLEDTLVIWGAEFGRTPVSEVVHNLPSGREHNPQGFTMWLAGGGTKRGFSYGATDDFGGKAVENPVTIHDLHATILHLLGIDHTKLTFRYGSRDFRLTDVYGNVVHEIIA